MPWSVGMGLRGASRSLELDKETTLMEVRWTRRDAASAPALPVLERELPNFPDAVDLLDVLLDLQLLVRAVRDF